MQSLVSRLLIGLIAACPLFCEAAESVQGLHQCRPDTTCGDHGVPSPSPCSDDGGNCVCSGAIQAAGVRVSDHDLAPPVAPTLLALLSHSPHPSLSLHRTRDGAPTGLAAFGDSGTVRALLQVYRC